MKRIIYTVFFIFLGVWSVIAQTNTENYVKTSVFKNEEATDKIESINYFDGLGRPKQQILVGQSPNGKDIIIPVEYDDYGRQDKDYLPFEGITTTGTYNARALDDVIDFYENDYNVNTSYPFSEKDFDASPLNRVKMQAAPGEDWKLGSEHVIEFEYSANTSEDAVVLFKVELNNNKEQPTLIKNDTYPAGQLYKNITKDENHSGTENDHTTEEFTNKQGQVVLKRTYNKEAAHDTYYVYDDYGNLTYVLPPKVTTVSVSEEELSELCYQYKYDHRNRLIEKKIPGKKEEYIIYNTLDQPVLTQDALLRKKKQWLFIKYDAFGRVTYTGIYIKGTTVTRKTMQAQVDAMDNTYESAQTSSRSLGGVTLYYTNNSFPQTGIEIYTVNYYDDYRFISKSGAPSTVFEEAVSSATKSLPTGSNVKIMETDDWITNYTLYDKKGRVIYNYSENEYLNTIDEVTIQYDFIGKVLKTRASHIKDNNEAIVVQDVFTYDHANRLIDQHQCIGDNSLSKNCGEKTSGDYSDPVTGELIAHNTYDALGQLESKKVGNNTSNPLQTIDYTYNIRGWLKTINNPNTSLGNDLFSFQLNYNTTTFSESEALFNGNISETHWKTANDNKIRSYDYLYDDLNRLTRSKFHENNINEFSLWQAAIYDKNGNITHMRRHNYSEEGFANIIDLLDYTYDDGNKLLAVYDNNIRGDDGSVRPYSDQGFKDGNTIGNDYTYDDNGNMIADANKGINKIGYNHLNLPTVIEFETGETIEYIYEAGGTKLSKEVSTGKTTDYAGNFIYEGDDLKFTNHPEGYIEPVNGRDFSEGFTYVYQYKDHLGNIRLSYADADEDGEVDVNEIREEKNYYPFGLQHKGYNNTVNGRQLNYGYNGKEEQNELGLNQLDYGARFYDPATGRWFTPDALAEKYYSTSPYTYALNNPIIYIDPDGNQVEMCCQGLKDFISDSIGGLERAFGNQIGYTPTYYGRGIDRSGPTKNITGNYFGDAAYKLLGGETFSKALNGDVKAQGQVIMNTIVALEPNVGSVVDNVVSSKVDNMLFRGDSRSPSTIFKEGFSSKGNSLDLADHAAGILDDSGFISTSTKRDVATNFAGEGGYIYNINKSQNSGVDVNNALGNQTPYPSEYEVAIPYEIPASSIQSAQQVGSDGNFIGPLLQNPNY